MEELVQQIECHRANHHRLFAWLRENVDNEDGWNCFATHYSRAIAAAPAYLAILRARLAPDKQEVLDHLLETTAPSRLLIPPKFYPVGEGVADVIDDLEHLPEVDVFVQFHSTTMAVKPLPVALGMLYCQHTGEAWVESMDLIIAPLLERLDLIQLGIEQGLNVRDRMWEAILNTIEADDSPF